MKKFLICILMVVMSHLSASYSLESIGGKTHIIPNQNQLLFIGSSKKSHQQIEGWFQALKKHTEIAQRYEIAVVPLVDGLFSSFLFRKGFIALLNKTVPERHRHIVVPVFKGDHEYPFFASFRKSRDDELQIVLFNELKEPVWRCSGEVSEEKILSLSQ